MMDATRERVLVVDDMHLNLHVLAELLKSDYEVTLAKTGHQAVQRALSDMPPDLILLDVMMPEMDGYQVISFLKEHEKTKDIPVIFITALSAAQDEEKGLRLGAVDYISKPFHPAIVRARVRNHLKIVRQRKLLENIALLDGLTEIPNRRCFDDRVIQEWNRAIRNGAPLSLAIVDVDFFKQFNDNYGHAHGDEVLKAVATRLRWGIRRPADFVARYGGEEFVILLPETTTPGAEIVAEHVRASVERLAIPHARSTISEVLTISVGGVTYFPHPGEPIRGMIELADRHLYKAKECGRNRVHWADEPGKAAR